MKSEHSKNMSGISSGTDSNSSIQAGSGTSVIADANPGNWVYAYAPRAIKPYLMLARIDRPVGVWLLLWPCLWSQALVTPPGAMPSIIDAILFTIGAIIMRGAGCTFNDIIDKDLDAKVARTSLRPLATGEVTRIKAFLFLILQGLIGLAILIQFNDFTIFLGLASLILVSIYPFMKRITWWPQAWLGLTFNWGALMGAASVSGKLNPEALILYAGCVFWTLGYDTIYAHQDREDDALIGIKSTARKLGHHTRYALIIFYGLFIAAVGFAFFSKGFGLVFALGFCLAIFNLLRQILRLDIHNSGRCLSLFKANINLGGYLLIAMILDLLI